MQCLVEAFFDSDTNTISYILFDPKSLDALIIDPVLDFDVPSSTLSYASIEKLVQFIENKHLNVKAILETHAHADHLTGAYELKKRFPKAPIGIGEHITEVQSIFKDVYNLKELKANGEQFDLLFSDGQVIQFGSITVKIISTPGHTPACISYWVDNKLFVGDVLFMPDSGTGRCDFPAGSAKNLYHSVHEKLYTLPDQTIVYTGHDYQPGGRSLAYCCSLLEQKEKNIHLKKSTSASEYIEFRQKRDATLKAPRLIYPSLQVNINGGKPPQEESNQTAYLKIPLYSKKID